MYFYHKLTLLEPNYFDILPTNRFDLICCIKQKSNFIEAKS